MPIDNVYRTQDFNNEIMVFNSIKDIFAPLKDLYFTHNKDYATIDFSGFKNGQLVLEVEIKCREVKPDTYKDYFVSTVKTVKALRIQTYIVYYFVPVKVARIFDLSALADEGLEERGLKWTHPRKGYKEEVVSLIPSKRFMIEYYLM